MNQYKIGVYVICKNEEKNILKWYENIKNADQIVVLDTGSTDHSVEILKKLNVKLQIKKYDFFRFDVARNDALSMLDEDIDICISMDIDERFNPSWREIITNSWDKKCQMLSYRYIWSFKEDGREGVVFYMQKIHSRHDFKWIHPVHEVLKYIGDGNYQIKVAEGLQLSHYPDPNKSRSQYLNLLELSVREQPDDDRNMHYLGREYLFCKKYDQAIETLMRHLSLKNATWKDERSASYRYIGRCYRFKNELEKAKLYYYLAIVEAPYLREAYLELATLLYELKDYYGTIYFIQEALKIKNRSSSYINETTSWDETPYDLLSIAYFYIQNYDEAIYYANMALNLAPNNERIKKNKELYLQKKQINHDQ